MICSGITIEFTFRNIESGELFTEEMDFDPSGSLTTDIELAAEEWIEGNEDGEFELVDTKVSCYDDDFGDPGDFADLDEYGEFVGLCEHHGEAYKLRYDDVGSCDMDDYNGCWDSEEKFAQHIAEELMEVPENLWCYIDWEKLARDVMMDYSSYEGEDGFHIFRD